MDIAKAIGRKLKEARKEAGYTQEEVAKSLGLTQVGYSALERGRTLISLEYLLQLPRILQKPITYFLPDSSLSEAERGDILLDPRIQDILVHWPTLPDNEQQLVHDLVMKLYEKWESKKMNKF